jgi:hypothetical protein
MLSLRFALKPLVRTILRFPGGAMRGQFWFKPYAQPS